MFTKPIYQIKRFTSKEDKSFIQELRKYINQEVHLKIEQDDSTTAYILEEVGRDYIVIHFAQIKRTVPIDRVIFFQAEASTHAPISAI